MTGARAHLKDGDLDGNDRARLILGPGVVLLAEHHDVDARRAERRADRRRRVRRPRLQRELDDLRHLLGHHNLTPCPPPRRERGTAGFSASIEKRSCFSGKSQQRKAI